MTRVGARRRWRGWFAAALIATAMMVVGDPASGAPVVIRGLDIRWSPASVSVSRGAVVKWKSTGLIHNVYAYGSNWTFGESLPSGASTKYRFSRRGTFRFRCTLHSTLLNGVCSGMCGSVRVS